MVAPPGLEPGT